MNQVDLEALIEQCTQQALTMSERADEGMKGLACLEAAVQAAEEKLRNDTAHSRENLSKVSKILDELEDQLNKRDAQVHQSLVALEEGSKKIEADALAATSSLIASSLALAVGSDDLSLLLQKSVAECQEQVDGVKKNAAAELTRLQTLSQGLAQKIGALQTQAATTQSRLDKALNQVALDQASLDKVLARDLEKMHQAYLAVLTATQKRLTELETQVARLVVDSDRHLDESLVTYLGGSMHKAARSFAQSLTELEKEIEKIGLDLAKVHRGFHKNLNKIVAPGVTKIAQGLSEAASNLGYL